jgi:hypothetical protein
MVMRALAGVLVVVAMASTADAQTPQPFPKPAPPPPREAPAQPPPQKPASPATAAPAPASITPLQPPAPDLGGIPLYPNAAYLGSYDAGRGQRFHLFGVKLPYADAVAFYRSALKDRGDELFQSPPTYQFEVGRFRETDMAFPPSVTIKDYTWGGSAGYMHPKLGAQPERFPTVIQVVPPPAAR